VDGGMLWRNGCDGKVLRCGAGNRHQHVALQLTVLWALGLRQTCAKAYNTYCSCCFQRCYMAMCFMVNRSLFNIHIALYNIIRTHRLKRPLVAHTRTVRCRCRYCALYGTVQVQEPEFKWHSTSTTVTVTVIQHNSAYFCLRFLTF
jgi:hypothetical protein